MFDLSFWQHGLLYGWLSLPWWQTVAVTLGLTHITIVSVTIFLHRSQCHRALDLHPIASHFFRFWLWMTTGMVTKEWVAVHRKHHATDEGPEDPQGPGPTLWKGLKPRHTPLKGPRGALKEPGPSLMKGLILALEGPRSAITRPGAGPGGAQGAH